MARSSRVRSSDVVQAAHSMYIGIQIRSSYRVGSAGDHFEGRQVGMEINIGYVAFRGGHNPVIGWHNYRDTVLVFSKAVILLESRVI